MKHLTDIYQHRRRPTLNCHGKRLKNREIIIFAIDISFIRMDVLDPICSPIGMNGEDDKKKETLERNK